MRLRRRQVKTEDHAARQPHDDGGGQGAEYVDYDDRLRSEDDDQRDRTAWSRARHWTPDRP